MLLFAAGDSTCPVPRGFVHEHALGTTGPPSGEKVHVRHAYGAARGFDIVHDHTLVGPLYSERIPDLPVVATNHGPFLPHLRDHYRSVTPRVKVIAISRAHAASARDVPIARVIHHGIDVDRMAFNESPGDYFLFLGRMSPDKGAHRAAGSRAPWASRYGSPRSCANRRSSSTSTRTSSRCSAATSSTSASSAARRSAMPSRAPACCSTRSAGRSRSGSSWPRPWPPGRPSSRSTWCGTRDRGARRHGLPVPRRTLHGTADRRGGPAGPQVLPGGGGDALLREPHGRGARGALPGAGDGPPRRGLTRNLDEGDPGLAAAGE